MKTHGEKRFRKGAELGGPKSVQSSLKVPKDEELEGSMKRLEVRTVNRGFDG